MSTFQYSILPEKYRGIMLGGPTFGTCADHNRKIGAQVMGPYMYKLLF